jgi:predicted dehydrogenase
MPASLNIGLIGCGRAAEMIYVPSLKKFIDINVSAVADPSSYRRELIAGCFKNCNGYSSIDQNFIDQIDAAIVCSPPDTHVSLASEILQNNKYVLVEKPLALSLQGIEELIKIELNSKASLMMGFNHRNWQPVVRLKHALSKGSKIISARIVFSGNYNTWNPVSFKTDALNDLGPHVFDMIRFIFDKPIISSSAVMSGKNNFDIKIKLADDVHVGCRIAHCDKNEKSIKIINKTGGFFIKFGSTRILPQDSIKRNIFDLTDTLKNKLLGKTSPIKESFDIQLNNFFSFVRGNKKAIPGIEDGIFALSAIEASIKSLNENGKEIFLNGIS